MDYLTFAFFGVLVLSFVMEAVDSSVGMMYGTILSPLLIGFGFDPKDIVPALVLSQAVGGIVASFQHHKFKNADFSWKSKDLKVAAIIFFLGVLAVIGGVFLGVKINKFALSLYIAILMTVMGIIVLFGFRFKFKWNRILLIGIVSSFNKALSGGGFGPIVTSGQVITGRSSKRSVGATTMSEVEICLASFIAWALIKNRLPDMALLVSLCAGAAFGGVLGPYLLSKIPQNKWFVRSLGIFAIACGVFALIEILT